MEWVSLMTLSQQKLLRTQKEEAIEGVAPSTQEGAARVVPATCPGKQEHFTVCDLSSILFLLQHL